MASVLPDTASDGKALTDAWDYKGRPASRATTGGWACAAMILGNVPGPACLPYHFASTAGMTMAPYPPTVYVRLHVRARVVQSLS